MNYLSTSTIFQPSPPAIDKEQGIISNVLVVQKGEAKGHNLFLNDNFLNDTVALANKAEKGIKARFGHPNMCATALGTYIGRYKNFHKEADNVLADLYLDKSAKISPNGNLYDYVLELAATNPDMFGSSIAFKAGKSTTLSEKDPTTQKEITTNYATIESLHAVDLVDEPAATNGLFAQFHANDWAFNATLFLDNNPSLLNVLLQNPFLYVEFLNKYLNNNNMPLPDEFKKFKEKITEFFQKNNISDPSQELHAERSRSTELSTKLETLQAETGIKDTLIEELQSNLTESISLAEQLQSQVELLSANKSVPPNLADPKLNINKSTDEDTAGKQLLKEIPYQDRMKLKANNQ